MSNKFGDNLRWFLGELANAEADYIEGGNLEVCGEGAGTHDCDVFELVGAAVELIDTQAARINELEAEAVSSLRDQYGNLAPSDAQTYDTFWRQFLKAENGVLHVRERAVWSISQHKDGVAVLENDEQIKLK